MKIYLVESGLDTALEQIKENLEGALNVNTKTSKNMLIHRAIGAIDAIYEMIDVVEEENTND